MVKSTIHKISDDVLLIIFEYLEAKSLLNASQVCKNWCKLIGSSTTTMKKLKLFLNKSNLPSIGDQVHWKHYNVVIQFGVGRAYRFQNDYLKNTLENIAETFNISSARNLTFIKNKKDDAHPVMTFLSLVPYLENLELYLEGRFNLTDESKMMHVALPKLKKMKIIWLQNHDFIFTFLKAEQLLELQLENYGPLRKIDNVVTDFLKGCTKLKKLSLSCCAYMHMFRSQQEYDFHLTHLEIACTNMSPTFFQNFIKFLISQSTTLTYFYINQREQYFEQVLRTIFLFKRLASISIDVYALPRKNSLFRQLKPITTLKELEIRKPLTQDDFTNYKTAQLIIEKCPNLQTLKLEYSYPAIFSHLSVLCPNLIKLSIDCVKDSTDIGQGFVNLKYLKVKCVSNMDNWMWIIFNIPSIEELEIEKISENQITENHFDALLSQPMLSHLILRSENPEDEDFIFCNTLYMNNNGELKTLLINFEKMHDLVMLELSLNISQWRTLEQKFLEKEILKNNRKITYKTYETQCIDDDWDLFFERFPDEN